ncbi:MAG: N-acetylglucosamine-6-phosphate deacetylase [Caldilineaceae bacterium]|nr:N-acetylglucosamine-6-phosphate deacetylase [Caldilineaceae bacterium]
MTANDSPERNLLIHRIDSGRFPFTEVATTYASEFQAGNLVFSEDGWIEEITPADSTPPIEEDQLQLDASGCTVLPGFIDVHIHGSNGFDTMDATPDALHAMSRFLARHGVTGFYATTMTASHAATLAAVQNAATVIEDPLPGARLLGVHLEGPYLSPEFPGAQKKAYVRDPNLAEFDELIAAGPVRLITLAPERPGADILIERARARGIIVILGHTAATYEQATDAIRRGAGQATHTFNAMTGLHHRQPGMVGATLSNDAIYAQIIPDNIHVHPAAMAILARCKGPDRTLLITDAIRAAGLPEGATELGGQPVTVRDGACRLADGTLAGSIVTMDLALRNFLQAADWSLAHGWPVSSRSAARSLGLDDELGTIAPGYRADLVLLDRNLDIVATLVGGRLVYLRDAWRLGGR